MQVQALGRPDVVAVALEERFEGVDQLRALALVVRLELPEQVVIKRGQLRIVPKLKEQPLDAQVLEVDRAVAAEQRPPDRECLFRLAVREGESRDARVVPPDADRDVAAGQQRGEPASQPLGELKRLLRGRRRRAWQRHGEAVLALSQQGAGREPQDLGPDQVGRLEALRT